MTQSCLIWCITLVKKGADALELCVCGANCEGCPNREGECQGGCQSLKGKVFWTKLIGVEVCPVYKCVEENGFANCGDCALLPCPMWFSLKDPELSDEEHQKSIVDRVAKLKIGKI